MNDIKPGVINSVATQQSANTNTGNLSFNQKSIEQALKSPDDFVKRLNMLLDGISMKELVNVSRQIAALLEAKINILKTFQLVADDQQKPFIKNVFDTMVNDIKGGTSVSQAMAKHPKVFDDFYVNMVRSGEESGKLSNSFIFLADYVERNFLLVSKVKNAMVYPAFVVVVFISVMILVFTMVIPKLAVILEDSNVSLPILTQIILGMSGFLVSYGIYLFIVTLGAGGYFWFVLRQTGGVQDFFDDIQLKLPLFKKLFKMFYVVRFADNMQTLLSSGVTLPKALQISSDVVGNKNYKKLISDCLLDVKGGVALSQALSKNTELIPKNVVQMVKIGEETSEIAALLGHVAKFYQREINGLIDTIIGLIEPAMIVVLGLGVGILLAAVLMPIYNLASAF